VALSIVDPDDPYRSLRRRYGMDYPITDADVRVVITISPDRYDRYIAVRSGGVVGREI
jgi:hypothetical protein